MNELHQQIEEAISTIGNPDVLQQYFDGAARIITTLGISADDKRLSFTARQGIASIRININTRLVYSVQALEEGELWMFMLRSHDFDALKDQIRLEKNGDFHGKDNMTLAEVLSEDISSEDFNQLLDLCVDCCAEYLPTRTGSLHRKSHLPELYQLAMDSSYRDTQVTRIIAEEASRSAIEEPEGFQKLIERYKALIRKDKNEPERYKWTCVQHFQNKFDIDAPEFYVMLREAIRLQENLIYHNSLSAILKAAEHFPEEVREMFRVLYDEMQPLEGRIAVFQKKAEEVVNRLKLKTGKKLTHQQDERTLSFYLAMRFPDRYPIYKSDVYNGLIKVLPHEQREVTGERFLHFISLGKTLLPQIEEDRTLQKLVAATLHDEDWKGPQQWLIFQDILYRNMNAITNDAVPVTEIDSSFKYPPVPSMQPLNQILYGPPGTGKTYNSINYALAIIEGKSLEEIEAECIANRKAVHQRFSNLIITDWEALKGQIGFITFHQSLSYEDFVEGIKPVEPAEGDEFLSYHIQDGIFRLMSRAAELSNTTDFDTAYKSLQAELTELGEQQLLLKTPRGKEFGISLNNRGNIKFFTGSREKAMGVLTREGLQKQLSGEDYFKWWLGYYNSVVDHLKVKHGYHKASTHERKPFVLIIDEINRGNVSKIFGELITLIEDGKRAGQPEALSAILPYSRESFSVPPNLYIIGTMNTADRSVEALDTALRRRFTFVHMPPDAGKLAHIDIGIDLVEMLETINNRLAILLDGDRTIGHAWLMGVESIEDLSTVFAEKIIPLLQEFFYNDLGKIGLVLGESFVRAEVVKAAAFAPFRPAADISAAYNGSIKYSIRPQADWRFETIVQDGSSR